MRIYNYISQIISQKGACYFILIDPDKITGEKLSKFTKHCQDSGADAFLIGGSLMLGNSLPSDIEIIKKSCTLPVIIFPGGLNQIVPNADALLYISLISGRNADQIIGKHVLAAPVIRKMNLETLSTGYMLIESGNVTTAEYMSGSRPIPRNKPEIAAATALAAEYMGMKFIYLEAGSGALNSVPSEMIKMVSSACSIPVIVGGGIRNAETAREKVINGAKIIVTGNYFEDEQNWDSVKKFSDAIHIKKSIEV